ncbi:RING finger protein 37 [Athalia rosae]|uniref:RING finger protein 37 n=1 Tax=Athalia rosae TaxID=37344 RepID=UPI002034037F|nr:RING finger protein 37 [Athalia rosae]
MLLNFCHPCLRPEISCSTISTEEYDVTNLISGSSKGFLAYSCIKPPINIDLNFICNVQIIRVIIWPAVGSQKSSGFQLLARSTNDPKVPFATLSSAFLNNESGVLFYRRDINETLTSVPPGFLARYIKISDQQAVNRASSLRLCIVKTENSVPAIGRIEVWGRASRCCGRDVIAEVNALWTQEHSPCISESKKFSEPLPKDINDEILEKSDCPLEIPEDFLDPITCEIMVQPIVLPSGKIVDHFTLERHEQNEALWGRSPSDPFTGIPFSANSRPAVATALKVRIDKFLIENSNEDEIKKLPRLLGRKKSQSQGQSQQLDVGKAIPTVVKLKSEYLLKRKIPHAITKNQHKLPIGLACAKQSSKLDFIPTKRTKFSDIAVVSADKVDDDNPGNISSKIDSELEFNVKSVLSGLKRFSTPETCVVPEVPKTCSCCTSDDIKYKLPCEHIVCRKVLTSIKILECEYCGQPYTTNDPKRLHE